MTKYATRADARAVHAEQNRQWHEPFNCSTMPWRVVVCQEIVAVFREERDARGFARARYGAEATVDRRASGKRAGYGHRGVYRRRVTP